MPLHPYAFIEQYGASTKRYIDDILTVAKGSQTEGPTIEQIIAKDGYIYGGMYPSNVKYADGHEMENPVFITEE